MLDAQLQFDVVPFLRQKDYRYEHIAQWLFTGAGLLHEEMFDLSSSSSRQELYQLWITVPAPGRTACRLVGPGRGHSRVNPYRSTDFSSNNRPDVASPFGSDKLKKVKVLTLNTEVATTLYVLYLHNRLLDAAQREQSDTQ